MNVYKQVKGLNVLESGDVIIKGQQHRVEGGFVVCNPGLNHYAWNTTQKTGCCEKCYPNGENLSPIGETSKSRELVKCDPVFAFTLCVSGNADFEEVFQMFFEEHILPGGPLSERLLESVSDLRKAEDWIIDVCYAEGASGSILMRIDVQFDCICVQCTKFVELDMPKGWQMKDIERVVRTKCKAEIYKQFTGLEYRQEKPKTEKKQQPGQLSLFGY